MQVSNIINALQRLGIDTKSPTMAITNVGALIREGNFTPEDLLDKIVGSKPPKFDNDIVGRVACQAVVEHIVKNKLDQFDVIEVLHIADARVEGLKLTNPELFKTNEKTAKPKTDEVVINDDGSVKKGGKQILAKKLFKERFHGKEFANKDLVEALIKECGLTKAGANTYSYNLRKQIPGWEIE